MTNSGSRSPIALDWHSAEVKAGKLCVSLEGKPDRDWIMRFKRTAVLLGRGQWEDVAVKKGVVQVGPVETGREEKLRHFLESLVAEANATLERENGDGDENQEPGRGEHDGVGNPREDQQESADERETRRFRSFAGDAGGPEQ